MLPQSGGKSQFPLLARGAEGCAQLARWSSTPSATQQPCCISPSVFLRPLGTKMQLHPQREPRRLPPQRHRISAVYAAAVTPAEGGRTSSVTVQRQGAAVPPSPRGRLSAAKRAPKVPSPNTHIQKSPAANAAGGLFRGIIPSSASDNGDGGGACDTCVCYRRGCTAQAR